MSTVVRDLIQRRFVSMAAGVALIALSAQPVAAIDCTVEFGINEALTLGSLQFSVDYSSAAGNFVGMGSGVQCEGLVGGFPTFNDQDNKRILNAALINVDGWTTPSSVVSCNYRSGQPLAVADIDLVTVDAASTTGLGITPLPTVNVASILCVGGCGDPTADGTITAADALFVLRGSVGLQACPVSACDATGDDRVTVTDALVVLRFAVGIGQPLVCGSTSTTTVTSTTSTTSSSTTTTTLSSKCPTNGPIQDLRQDCSSLTYVYLNRVEGVGLVTDGSQVVLVISDGTDGVELLGDVTGARSFRYDFGCVVDSAGNIGPCGSLAVDTGSISSRP